MTTTGTETATLPCGRCGEEKGDVKPRTAQGKPCGNLCDDCYGNIIEPYLVGKRSG